MVSTFKISEKEYVKASKLFNKPTKKVIYIYLASLILLISLFILCDALKCKIMIIGAIAGGIIGDFITRQIYLPWQTKKQYKIYKVAQEPRTINYSKNGLKFKIKTGEATIEWDRVYKWRENNDFLLLYQAPRIYHIIRKRLGDIVIKIEEALNLHVGKAI